MENELEKRMEHDMETGRIRVYGGLLGLFLGLPMTRIMIYIGSRNQDVNHCLERVQEMGKRNESTFVIGTDHGKGSVR